MQSTARWRSRKKHDKNNACPGPNIVIKSKPQPINPVNKFLIEKYNHVQYVLLKLQNNKRNEIPVKDYIARLRGHCTLVSLSINWYL